MKVYFFGTCLGSTVYSNALMNSIKLLQHFGVEVIYKKDQTCCGQPSYNSGFYEETKTIALHQINLFNEPYPIVVPSGSCTGMMSHDYIDLFKGTEHEKKVEEFSKRVFDLGEFLHKELKVELQDTGKPVKITWHSNCHGMRIAKCTDSAKALLRQLSNVELIELEREDKCCGFGGTFSVKEPEISKAMVERKIQDIVSRNVEYIIAGDAGCLLNISGAMDKMGIKIGHAHLYDFLAERTGIA